MRNPPSWIVVHGHGTQNILCIPALTQCDLMFTSVIQIAMLVGYDHELETAKYEDPREQSYENARRFLSSLLLNTQTECRRIQFQRLSPINLQESEWIHTALRKFPTL